MEKKIMKCEKCGEELKANAKFCPKCGNAVTLDNTVATLKKKKSPIIYIVAVICAVCIIGGIVFYKTRPEVLDLKEYVTCEISGYNGYGKAYIGGDEDKLINDIYALASEKKDLSYTTPEDFVGNLGLKFDVTPSKKLSNGDIVKIKYTFDNKLMKQYGMKFKGETQEIKVKNLKKVKKVDIFKKLKIKYEGTGPEAYTDSEIEIKAGGEEFYCTVEPNVDLKPGDKLTIKCTNKEPNNGKIPAKFKTTVTVPDTIEHYVLNPTELTTENLTIISEKVQEELDEEGKEQNIYLTSPSNEEDAETQRIYDFELKNIVIGNEIKYYVNIKDEDGRENYNIAEVPVEFDATCTNDFRDNYGQTIHCYGWCKMTDIRKRKSGQLKIDAIELMDFAVSPEDREMLQKEDWEDENKEAATTYKLTLDGTTTAEEVKEQ